jgi:hypothetical protein
MKTLAFVILGGLALVSAPLGARAVDVTGDWAITASTEQGPISGTLTLKVDGEKLTGTLVVDAGTIPIEGTVKDGEVSFSLNYPTDNGDIPVTMTGKVDGDTIKGTYDAGPQGGGDWSGSRVKK